MIATGRTVGRPICVEHHDDTCGVTNLPERTGGWRSQLALHRRRRHLRLRHTGRRAYATAPIEAADGCAVTVCGM